jgi:hypothetical protein
MTIIPDEEEGRKKKKKQKKPVERRVNQMEKKLIDQAHRL